jgi:hypothetical protein
MDSEERVESQSDDDQKILYLLKKAGSDLSKPHPITFYLYFRREDDARNVAEVLNKKGYVSEVIKLDDVNWFCLAHIETIPTLQTIKEKAKELKQISMSHNGEYDGWESTVIK